MASSTATDDLCEIHGIKFGTDPRTTSSYTRVSDTTTTHLGGTRDPLGGGDGVDTYYERGTTSEHIGTDNRRPDLIAWPLGVAP